MRCYSLPHKMTAARALLAAAIGLSTCHTVFAAAIGPGDIVVERIGGDASFGGYTTNPAVLSAVPVFADEFDPANPIASSRVQTIGLPTATGGATTPQIATEYYGNDNNSGYMNLSADGNYLVTTAYNSAVGTADPNGAGNARRALAMIKVSDGSVNTATSFRWSSNSAQRSVATVDATTGFYIVTDSSTQGTRYVAGTGTTAQQTPAGSAGRMVASANRTVRIYGGKLFMSTSSTTVGQGMAIIDPSDSSLPTASASTAFAEPVTAFATAGTGGSPEQFVMLDKTAQNFDSTGMDTAYVADSGTSGTAGAGLQKWTFDGTSWSLAYVITKAGSLLGLDSGGVDSSGNPIFYATTLGSGAGNKLVEITDMGSASASTSLTLSTAPAGTYFRGVNVLPGTAAATPEPASIGAIAIGVLGLMRRRRQSA